MPGALEVDCAPGGALGSFCSPVISPHWPRACTCGSLPAGGLRSSFPCPDAGSGSPVRCVKGTAADHQGPRQPYSPSPKQHTSHTCQCRRSLRSPPHRSWADQIPGRILPERQEEKERSEQMKAPASLRASCAHGFGDTSAAENPSQPLAAPAAILPGSHPGPTAAPPQRCD